MSDPSDEIMAATYRALCERGYADLTMQAIADETDKSKAALHYHYDSKGDLLESFLEYLCAGFVDRVCDPPGSDPAERLEAFVDAALTPPDRDDQEAFQTAVLEIKGQAPYNEAFREQLRALDETVRREVRSLVEEGIEAGVFREEIDPEDTARFVVTALEGAHTRQVSIGQDFACTRRMLTAFIETHLRAPGGDSTDDGEREVAE